jgi:hypothetical protein
MKLTLKKWAGRTLVALLAALSLVYAGDYLDVRYRMTRNQAGNPFDVVTIQPTYVIAEKGGKGEIILGQPQSQTCVHSLFPHYGYSPCWYLMHENGKPQVIGGSLIFAGPLWSGRGILGGFGHLLLRW